MFLLEGRQKKNLRSQGKHLKPKFRNDFQVRVLGRSTLVNEALQPQALQVAVTAPLRWKHLFPY